MQSKESTDRKQVSWRLDKLPENESSTINTWLSEQSNIQKSITNVILHTIERFGNKDIMNHDIQKVLYSDNPIAQEEVIVPRAEVTQPKEISQAKPPKIEKEAQIENKSINAKENKDKLDLKIEKETNTKTQTTEKNEDNDWFASVDENSL